MLLNLDKLLPWTYGTDETASMCRLEISIDPQEKPETMEKRYAR